MPTLSDLTAALESLAPLRLAEPWDNVGLLLGDPSAEVSRALLTIDCTDAVFDEAVTLGCQLIVSYHPVIFDGLKRVTPPSIAWRAVREGVAVYSPHTALDIANGGTNDVLADAVGMTARGPIRPLKEPHRQSLIPGGGMGRIGPVEPIERALLIDRIKRALGLDALLVAGPTEGVVTQVAVGAGACGDLLQDVLARGAGLYLTGELRHHDALKAAARGTTVVMTLHSNSERATLARLQSTLSASVPTVTFLRAKADRDPFEFR